MTSHAHFVKVDGNAFHVEGAQYRFAGVNYWQAMHLGASNPERLRRELDHLARLGLTNVRIMATFDGPPSAPFRAKPATWPHHDRVNESLLLGLDRVLAELRARHMRAVVCLSNFWFWSGGLAQLYAWQSGERIPYPVDAELNELEEGWAKFASFAAKAYADDRLYRHQVERLVRRQNTLTDRLYCDDSTIMAWQLANEPRGAGRRDEFLNWIARSVELIREVDEHHLVSLGSEGSTPSPEHAGLDFEADHSLVDYATIHIWPQNWGWFDPLSDEVEQAVAPACEYLQDHAHRYTGPLVLEETGLARDQGSLAFRSSTANRDTYFRALVACAAKHDLAGFNAWAFAGEGRPVQRVWRDGSPWVGDPPHEPQGWYSIYDSDRTTLEIIASFSSPC